MIVANNQFAEIEKIIAKGNVAEQDIFVLAARLQQDYNLQEDACAKLLADWYFAKDQHNNCLIACSYYAALLGQSDSLLSVIEIYYAAHLAETERIYECNRTLLQEYPWCSEKQLLPFKQLEQLLIYQDEESMFFFERATGNMNRIIKDVVQAELPQPKVRLLYGFNHLQAIKTLLDTVQYKIYEVFSAKRPTYIFFKEKNGLETILQTAAIDEVLKEERAVFFSDWESMQDFLGDMQSPQVDETRLGGLCSTNDYWNFTQVFDAFKKKKVSTLNQKQQDYYSWYSAHQSTVLANIQKGKPKVMFITSRFTTALQYHTRDCAEACRRIGCEVRVLIEKSDIHTMLLAAYIDMIDQFRPDIIFVIDYFREKDIMPPEIVHVCWAQDPIPHIVSCETSKSLIDNDYVLCHVPNLEELEQKGHHRKKLLAAPIPADHILYQPYSLTAEELDKYQADICLVAHAGCFEAALKRFRTTFSAIEEPILMQFEQIFRTYYQLLYQEKVKLTPREEMYDWLRKSMEDRGIKATLKGSFELVAEHFYLYLSAVAFRSVLVEWLIDGGYTNLKLYGRDWADDPKFLPYAMGVAANGQPLAKIYQAAKITLGSNPHTTGAARVYECYLSGGFYIANYIDPKRDSVDLRNLFQEGEEIPFFYDRQDLYQKIDAYLEQNEKRKEMAQAVRQKMLEEMTYEVLMKRMIQWLGKGEDNVQNYLEQFQRVLAEVENTDLSGATQTFTQITALVVDLLTTVKTKRDKIFFAGNGGSAGIALHMTADFLKNGGMRAQSLHEAATMTCLGNDLGYEFVFSKQLELAADQGDVLVAISSSGNSPNILQAVRIAREKGCHVITLSGFGADNQLRRLGDYNYYVPVSHYGIVESIHNFILQMIVDLITERDGVAIK